MATADDAVVFRKWCDTTSPFEVVRHCTPREVPDDAIEDILRNTPAITTLEELQKQSHRVAHLVGHLLGKMVEAILVAKNRSKKALEKVLGGLFLLDEACIATGSFAYTQKAVSVKPTTVADKGRHQFSLVLGSSGSGKTYFALYHLPRLIFRQSTTEQVLTVHFQADAARLLMDEANNYHNFPAAVKSLVEAKIQRELEGVCTDDNKNVQLFLHVVIDEAGSEQYKPYFDTADKINSIASALETMMFKFQSKKIHVTVVGTRLENSTGAIKSLVDCTKFRMQPWTDSNFNALVASSEHPQQNMVIDAVKGNPILYSLISNARCAYYLLISMNDYAFLHQNHVNQFVNVIVSRVAESYLRSNGLDLNVPADRWQVAKSVFKAVDEASKTSLPFLVEFKDLGTEKLRAAAASLLDISVELSDTQQPIFMGDAKTSVSMSSAVAIILAKLLNANASLAWDWQAFDATVALCEWKSMVSHSESIPNNVDRTILELPTLLPSVQAPDDKNAEFVFKVPVVNNCTVVVNAPRAPYYADIIAPYRLVQAKYSNQGANATKYYLNLITELNKMGLTKTTDPKWRLQQAITTVLYPMWGSDPMIQQRADAILTVARKIRSDYFPYNSFVSGWIQTGPTLHSSVWHSP
jgi:hypothetical protein